MNFKKTVLFEDDFQEENEKSKTKVPPQQIVINNSGTVVIQSPNSKNSDNLFDDDIKNEENGETENPIDLVPKEEVNSEEIIFDDENQNMEMDPDYKIFKNPKPDLDDIEKNKIKYDINQLPDGEIPNSINDTESNSEEVFDDDLPNKETSQEQIPQPEDSLSEIPVNSKYFDDDVPSNINNSIQPNQNISNEPIFNDDIPSQQMQGQVQGQPQFAQLDPNTNQILPQEQQPANNVVDPSLIQQDPNTPVDPSLQQIPQQGVDPTTGLPIVDPNSGGVIGVPTPNEGYTDEANPEFTVGNASEVKSGAPVALEDITRISELKKINSQLMRVKSILEKELSNRYNKVEDKLNESIEFFRNIIMNLDSFSTQIDDIIFKYKRFILAILTEINTLKKQEKNEKPKR